MNEPEGRLALVAAGIAWLNTPYRNSGCLRGQGANCAVLLYGIARDAGVLPVGVPPPKWYSPQFHCHSREERLILKILGYGCLQIREDQVKPGDVVAYMTGQSHGHLALVVDWPMKIIQTTQLSGCQYAHGLEGRLAGCTREFYSLWPPENGDNKR